MNFKHTPEKLYAQTIEEESRTSLQVLAILAFSLFPLFSILDYVTQREHFGILSLIRFSTTFIFLGVHFAFQKGHWLSRPVVTTNILLALASLSITLMCMVLGGSTSPYYAGVNLVVLAGVLILPLDAKTMTKTVSMIIGIYVAGVFLIDRGELLNPSFVNNFFFLSATGVIGVTSAHNKHRLRREVFFKNIEKGEVQSELATRDGFISMASHELKTPLTSMKLQLDIALLKLRDPGPDIEGILRSVSTAYRQIYNILRLVDEMLDVSRIQSGKFILTKGPVELSDLVSGVILRNYSEQMSSGKISYIPGPQLLKGHWDAYKLEQVIVNLLNNALKYGGNTDVKVETALMDGYGCLMVRDKGPGIDPENQKKIFEKFERGKEQRGGGLGLGLYICREIVSVHNGRIDLRSSPEGTEFKVLLPLA